MEKMPLISPISANVPSPSLVTHEVSLGFYITSSWFVCDNDLKFNLSRQLAVTVSNIVVCIYISEPVAENI